MLAMKTVESPWREVEAVLIIYVGAVVGGIGMGYSAVAIPDIESETLLHNSSLFYPLNASAEELSWAASSISLGQIIGGIPGGLAGARYGPKFTMLLSCVPCAIGWITISLSTNIYLFIIGRILTGIFGSCLIANCPMLVAQYSSVNRRGPFLSAYPLMFSIGILISYCTGLFLCWRLIAVLPVCLTLAFVVMMLRLPESPIWLLGHRGESAAVMSLEWLRGGDVQAELQELKLTQENENRRLTISEALRNLRKRSIHRPILLVVANMSLVMMCGPFAIVFYAVQIFESTGIQMNNYVAAIIMALIRIFGGILAIFFVKIFNRVHLGVVCITVMGLCMCVLGVCMYCIQINFTFPASNILPLLCLTVYMLAFGAGIGPLQWVWMGEFIPPEYKVLSGITTSIATSVIFVNTKMFPNLLVWLNTYGTYWLFSSICMVTALLYVTTYPETKGKSLLEIKQMFNNTEASVIHKKERDACKPVGAGFRT